MLPRRKHTYACSAYAHWVSAVATAALAVSLGLLGLLGLLGCADTNDPSTATSPATTVPAVADSPATPGVTGRESPPTTEGTAVSPTTLGGDSTTTTTPPPDLPPLATYIYDDPDGWFTFAYPKGWKLTQVPAVQAIEGGTPLRSVGAFDPTGGRLGSVLLDGVAVSSYQLGVAVSDDLLPAFREELADLLTGLEGRLQSFETVEPLAPRTVGESQGFEVTFRFTRSGKRMRSHVVFLVEGNRQYQITSQATDAEWDVVHPMLRVVLDTFRLNR
ncbi:MAG: hypothetical protein KKA32_04605 [Actinobacteria bacterium]|nr:hypothetical protein [Actinomycetota bacterium]